MLAPTFALSLALLGILALRALLSVDRVTDLACTWLFDADTAVGPAAGFLVCLGLPWTALLAGGGYLTHWLVPH